MTHSAHIAAIIRETRDHRPRRPQQSRSTRPRAEVRASHRTHGSGIPNERRSYILHRLTLTGEAVFQEYVNRRLARIERAEVNVKIFADHVRYHYDPRLALMPRRVARWQVEDQTLLAFYLCELTVAKRSAARFAGELVTVPVVSIYAA